MPARGSVVETPDGPGKVIDYNVPSDTVKVRLAESGRTCSCSRASVCGSRQAYEQRYGDDAATAGPDTASPVRET